MSDETRIERNLGPQPIAAIMTANNLKPHDLVKASPHQITHKMIARACKGRRLTENSRNKVLEALNAASAESYTMEELFNY